MKSDSYKLIAAMWVKSGLMLLVFAMIIGSVIGLYYYIRVIAVLFSTSSDKAEWPATSFIGNVALTIVTVSILVLGLYPGWLIEMITRLVAL